MIYIPSRQNRRNKNEQNGIKRQLLIKQGRNEDGKRQKVSFAAFRWEIVIYFPFLSPCVNLR